MVQKLLYVCERPKTNKKLKYTKNPHNTENFKLAKHLNSWFEWQLSPIILLTLNTCSPADGTIWGGLGGKGTGEQSMAGELWDKKPYSIPSSLSLLWAHSSRCELSVCCFSHQTSPVTVMDFYPSATLNSNKLFLLQIVLVMLFITAIEKWSIQKVNKSKPHAHMFKIIIREMNIKQLKLTNIDWKETWMPTWKRICQHLKKLNITWSHFTSRDMKFVHE